MAPDTTDDIKSEIAEADQPTIFKASCSKAHQIAEPSVSGNFCIKFAGHFLIRNLKPWLVDYFLIFEN